jgi:hypothetical protein
MSNIKVGARQQVYQAIVDICNAHRTATRGVISKVTGLKMAQVDDHVKNLKDDGKIVSPVNGVFEPVAEWPEERPISKTVLPSGIVKVELGDSYLELTPHEARTLGQMFYGEAIELIRLRNERDLTGDLVSLRQYAKEERRWRADITEKVAKMEQVSKKQMSLLDDEAVAA